MTLDSNIATRTEHSVPELIKSCVKKSAPLIIDLSCFEPSRTAVILDYSKSYSQRCEAARMYESFGRSFNPLITHRKSQLIYFPKGVYYFLERSSHELSDCVEKCMPRRHIPKNSRKVEPKTINFCNGKGVAQLAHDVQKAYRVWSEIRHVPYQRTIPDSFTFDEQKKYESRRDSLLPFIQEAFQALGVAERLFPALESVVVGAVTLASRDADMAVQVATREPLIPDLFVEVYKRSKRGLPRVTLPRVVVSFFGREREPRRFYFP